ncbi:hypothetical protein [Gluconobacter albidus]|nr:hypothetical protein [Gluconobacter albidus]
MQSEEDLRKEFSDARKHRGLPPTRLPPGGGGPYDSDMEKLKNRVELIEAGFGRIEKSVEKLDDRLRNVEGMLSEMKGTLSTLSSTLASKLMSPWQMVGVFGGIFGVVVMIGGAVLTTAKWLGILHVSPN